jgi:polysaccharide biosynthesis protein PelG
LAGIGFELQKAVQEETYLGAIRGYLYAAVISAGPWIVSVAALSLLGVFSAPFLSQEATTLFAATITHTFAISLITTGVMQMVVTRYLADELYLKRAESIAPAFVTVLAISSGAQFVIINALFALTDLPLGYRLPAASLYVAVSGIWVAMIFLSAARDYLSIVLSFAAGYALSIVAALALGERYGLTAYLLGFAAGQVAVLGLLTWRVLAEFELRESFSLDFAGHFRRYPSLVYVGFAYNLALWIDKIVFWVSPQRVDVESFIGVFPVYDTSFFVASVVIMPSLAVFVVSVETDFYLHYRRFYEVIRYRLSLTDLEEAKSGMIHSLLRSYAALLKVQGLTTLVAATVLAAPLARLFNIPEGFLPMLRVLMVGMSVQVFVLLSILILLYLDLRGSVMIVCSVFLLTNLVFTVLTLPGGFSFYGYGFLASSVVSLAVALALLVERFKNLEYLTFARQPIA